MQFIAAQDGQLQTLTGMAWQGRSSKAFSTGMPLVDAMLPEGKLPYAAIHEVLSRPEHGAPRFFAALLARAATSPHPNPLPEGEGIGEGTRGIIWCDPSHQLYPPALAAMGLPLERVFLLHPKDEREAIWAVTECLRCRGVGAVIAAPGKLSQIEARRLQLAAERGGGVGILLRNIGAMSTHYAAATRWVVSPRRGERTVQRWKVELIHGHGGRLGQSVILEHSRETGLVCATAAVADRSRQTPSTPRQRAIA